MLTIALAFCCCCPEHPELAVYGLQSSPDKMEGGEIYCCMPSFLLEVPQLIERAVQAGAHALLIPDQAIEVEGVKEAIPETVPALFVPVVDHMAQQLAAAFYDDPSADLMVVAVSGSHGKTTVSWLIRGVLEEMQQVGPPGAASTGRCQRPYLETLSVRLTLWR